MDVSPNDFVICPRFTTLRIAIPLKYIIRVRCKEDLIELLINERNTYRYWHSLKCSRTPELFQEFCKALQIYVLENAHSLPAVQPQPSPVNATRPSHMHKGTTASGNGERRIVRKLASSRPSQPADVDAGYETAWNFTVPPKPLVLYSELAAQNGQALVLHANNNEEEIRTGDNSEYGGYGMAWNLSELRAMVATDEKVV